MNHRITAVLAAANLVIGIQIIQVQVVEGVTVVPFDQPPAFPHNPTQANVDQALDSGFFIQSAFTDNNIEIIKGDLAATRASAQPVKELALVLVRDHKMLTDTLKTLAEKKHTIVSTQLNPKQQATIDELTALSGTAFDKRYLADQVTEHERAIEFYVSAAAKSTDSDMKNFTENTLPTLRKDLQLAQEGGIGGGSAVTGAAPPPDDKK